MASVKVETAEQIVKSSVPKYIRAPSTTQTWAIHKKLRVTAQLIPWDDFEQTVRLQGRGNELRKTHLQHSPKNLKPNHISNEQLFCGNELSIHARFFQNVCHPMTSVYRDMGILCRFGDDKGCAGHNLGGEPDIVCLTDTGQPRLVGEMKTPWAHNIEEAMDPARPHRETWLAQITQYMFESGCRYGFLSTYEQTVFLKLERYPQNSSYALWYSDIILSNTAAKDVKPQVEKQVDKGEEKSGKAKAPGEAERPVDKADYRDQVSLKECFLFLGREIQNENWSIANPANESDNCYRHL